MLSTKDTWRQQKELTVTKLDYDLTRNNQLDPLVITGNIGGTCKSTKFFGGIKAFADLAGNLQSAVLEHGVEKIYNICFMSDSTVTHAIDRIMTEKFDIVIFD